MGDPRRLKKKYKAPMHLWRKEMIETERDLCKEYGLKNKKELWKLTSKLKGFKDQAKKLIALETTQAKKEKTQLSNKLTKYGLLTKENQISDILDVDVRAILGRRLQSLVFSLGLARSMKQARQFIVHRHVMINDKKVSSPNYLVTLKEEANIKFSENSKLDDLEHPERKIVKKEEETEAETEEKKTTEKVEKVKEEKKEVKK